jgi:hypothetical protein
LAVVDESTMSCPTRTILSLCLGALFALSERPAQADNWDGWGAGPVLGYAFDRGFSFGWEFSGGTTNLALRGATGVFYRPGAEDPHEIGLYVAYEPWVVVGGTLGFAVSNEGAKSLYGLWEGLGRPLGYYAERDYPQTLVTLTLGWRRIGTTHELYFTPKYTVYEAFF